ncbi:hypothetical protein ACS5PN_03835 [Roseateles sp. NT4]|uniref:hypothetical protein n=1 Tax=Roseateles sp. NT4 TaxID=3453715 RepID=UPI003EEB6029
MQGGFIKADKQSQTETTTNSTYNDNRSVQDAGYGVIGSGSVDNSTSSSFYTRDSGNVSNTNSGNSSYQVLDGGAIGKAFDSTDKTVSAAFKFGDSALGFGSKALAFGSDTVDSALGFAKQAQAESQSAISSAFDKALKASTDSTRTVVDSLNSTASAVERAFADAKGRGSMTDTITMLAIGGALFVAFMATRK